MVSTEDLLIGLLRPRLFRLGIERFHRVARSRSGFLFSCRSIAELEWLEQFIELVACGIAFPGRIRGIVPRMMFFVSIRVAEPWTPFSVVALVVLLIVLMTVVIMLVRRS